MSSSEQEVSLFSPDEKKICALCNHTLTRSLENRHTPTQGGGHLNWTSLTESTWFIVSSFNQTQGNHSFTNKEFHCRNHQFPCKIHDALWKFRMATSCIFSPLNMHNLKHTRGKRERDWEWGWLTGVSSGGILRSSCASVSPKVWALCQKTNTLLFHMSWFCGFFTKSCSCQDFTLLTSWAVPDFCVGPFLKS